MDKWTKQKLKFFQIPSLAISYVFQRNSCFSKKTRFLRKTSFYIHMRRGSRARSKAFLTVVACRDVVDVVEAVKSMCIQLSLISAARHPLHQAISLLFSVFFFLPKIGFMLKNIFLKISFFDTFHYLPIVSKFFL